MSVRLADKAARDGHPLRAVGENQPEAMLFLRRERRGAAGVMACSVPARSYGRIHASRFQDSFHAHVTMSTSTLISS